MSCDCFNVNRRRCVQIPGSFQRKILLISIYRHKQQNSKMALKFDLFRHSVFRLFPRGKREKNEGGLMNINDELNKQF